MHALERAYRRIDRLVGSEVVTTRSLIGLISRGRYDRQSRELATSYREARLHAIGHSDDGEMRYSRS